MPSRQEEWDSSWQNIKDNSYMSMNIKPFPFKTSFSYQFT